MEPLVRIAEGLDVAPVLAELRDCADYWFMVDAQMRQIPLIGAGLARLMEDQLPSVWKLIDIVHDIAARDHRDRGSIAHARMGLLRPGEGINAHFDGMNGVSERRYHIAIQSDPGAELTVAGETICLKPGEAWWVDVSKVHSVANKSGANRILALFDTCA
jgi:hypothetical protein